MAIETVHSAAVYNRPDSFSGFWIRMPFPAKHMHSNITPMAILCMLLKTELVKAFLIRRPVVNFGTVLS